MWSLGNEAVRETNQPSSVVRQTEESQVGRPRNEREFENLQLLLRTTTTTLTTELAASFAGLLTSRRSPSEESYPMATSRLDA